MPTTDVEQTQLASPSISRGVPAGRWLQVLSHIDPKFGGLSAAIPKLAQNLITQQGINTSIAAFAGPEERGNEIAMLTVGVTVWPPTRKAWLSQPSLRRRFRKHIQTSAGVHIHGLWEMSTLAAATEARRAGVPYVLSPHGMLEPWALANKGLKKRIYSTLFEHRNVNAAACLIALTQAEARDCRHFGYKGPIAVIPNGVDAATGTTPELFLQRFPKVHGKRMLLFLGRIHYKKGIDLLIKAWEQLAEKHPDVLLVVAGPDSEGSLGRIKNLLNVRVASRVLFTDMLDGPRKWSALAASDFFVLPSYSEGLSVATLEALSLGVPVILSEQCNLPQVPQAGAGWQTKTNVEDLARTLDEALSTDSSHYWHMRDQAKALAEREFSWRRVTDRTAELYHWLNGGARPLNVDFFEGGL